MAMDFNKLLGVPQRTDTMTVRRGPLRLASELSGGMELFVPRELVESYYRYQAHLNDPAKAGQPFLVEGHGAVDMNYFVRAKDGMLPGQFMCKLCATFSCDSADEFSAHMLTCAEVFLKKKKHFEAIQANQEKKCRFCGTQVSKAGKVFETPRRLESHEDMCQKNPKNLRVYKGKNTTELETEGALIAENLAMAGAPAAETPPGVNNDDVPGPSE